VLPSENLRIPGDKFLHVNGSPSKDAFPRNQFRYAAIWRDRSEPLNPVILRLRGNTDTEIRFHRLQFEIQMGE
jgi:hypothetical protein